MLDVVYVLNPAAGATASSKHKATASKLIFSVEFLCTRCDCDKLSNYLLDSATKKPIISSQLLEQMIDWMTSDPRLALTSIHQTQYLHSQRSTLWTSPTKPNTQTPIPGLVRWCTKAPLMMALQRKKSVNC